MLKKSLNFFLSHYIKKIKLYYKYYQLLLNYVNSYKVCLAMVYIKKKN